jgi:probable phosphoglycerate mutase
VRVFVARHGETTWNRDGRYQGRRESPLSPLGLRQAAALVAPMQAAQVGRILSSPLSRCTATATPSAEALGLAVHTDARLIEIAHGTWEGRLRDEIAANDRARYRAWREDPGNVAFEAGESPPQVLERWHDFAATLQPQTPVLVVTHDAVVRVALLASSGGDFRSFWQPRVENGAYATFEVEGTRWTLVEECVTAHLAGVRAAIEGQAL